MTTKKPLVPGKVRRPPPTGWSWIDRSFLSCHAAHLTTEAILLYMFLAAVADRMGLSFWSDATVAARLHIDEDAVARGRDELVERGLIAYRRPLTQVLSLPVERVEKRDRGAMPIREILRSVAAGIRPCNAERDQTWT
jgi:hypothetical protein